MPTYTEQQIEDWGMIFGAGATVWSWWREIRHETGGWNEPGVVALVVDDPNEDDRPMAGSFTPEQVFAALDAVERKYPHVSREDLDAGDADLVLQTLIFDDIVYG